MQEAIVSINPSTLPAPELQRRAIRRRLRVSDAVAAVIANLAFETTRGAA